MAHRDFLDQAGVRWEVWLTIPTKPERRHSAAVSVPPALDRRRRHEFRVPLGKQWINGWLTFRSDAETRRLAPFPKQWADLTDEQLAVLTELAEPAKRHADG